jgi:pyrroline-5-carboxylate reductase
LTQNGTTTISSLDDSHYDLVAAAIATAAATMLTLLTTLGSTNQVIGASTLLKLVLSCFGDYIEVPESMMNSITALSGSGPAYIAILIEAMVSAGLKVGIPRDIAFKLVTKTLTGTADLLSTSKMHPAELRDSVTTPAGTTIAGIYELEKGSLRTSIMNAVEAATAAAEKVAKRFEND